MKHHMEIVSEKYEVPDHEEHSLSVGLLIALAVNGLLWGFLIWAIQQLLERPHA